MLMNDVVFHDSLLMNATLVKPVIDPDDGYDDDNIVSGSEE